MSALFSPTALVVPFENLRMTDVEAVGGKNASLGEMISQLPQGVRVPTGFATTAHAFREFLAFGGLADKINARLAALDTDDVRALAAAGAEIRGWVEAQPFPADLEKAIREAFAAFCGARPVGAKFAHRATDGPAGSSPSMKWVNPPVAFMMHAGVPRLIAAGAHLPGLLDGDPQRVALEAYPGLLARSVLGTTSYKSDDRAKQTGERLIARKTLINALENGQAPLLQAAGLRLRLTHAQRDDLADDASGDRLDAVLCLLQAAWALQRHRAGDARWGLPDFDPLEGWIVGS